MYFTEKELRGFSPNFHILVSVSEAEQFLFWEYLFRVFGIVPLQRRGTQMHVQKMLDF